MGELSGQVAIVTGGGRGIGRGIAHALAAAGADVVVTARSADQLSDTVATIRSAGGQAEAIPADVTDAIAFGRVVAGAEQLFGPVSLLVNNAGAAGPIAPLWELDLTAWWHDISVHVLGAAIGAQAVLPAMIRRGQGRIINVVSSLALRAVPYASAYTVAKTALLRLTETLALETREHGISVFAIEPGAVRTAAVNDLLASPWAAKALPAIASIGPEAIWGMTPAGAGQLCVRLASGSADVLAGRFLDVRTDLDDLIQQAPTIQSTDLYTLRLRVPGP